MHASRLMTRDVITCSPEDSLDDAARKMWEHDIGCLPVVNADNHVVGMVTDRDICMAAFTQGRTLKDVPVKSAMAQHVYARLDTDRLQDLECIMMTYKVRRIPIVDKEGVLVGLVSINDMAREAARELKERNADVTDAGLVTTLARICEPRNPAPLPLAAE